MTLDEAFGRARDRCQGSDRGDPVLTLMPFVEAPNVTALVDTALETIVNKLVNDPEEKLSVSQLIEGALLAVIVRAYNAGLAAGRD